MKQCYNCGYKLDILLSSADLSMSTTDGVLTVRIIWTCPNCEAVNGYRQYVPFARVKNISQGDSK